MTVEGPPCAAPRRAAPSLHARVPLWHIRAMTAARQRAVLAAAALCSAGVVAILLTSNREDADLAWAVLGPIVVWSFIGTGLYAAHRRPESRIGLLMDLPRLRLVLVAVLAIANAPLAYSVGLVVAGLWGGCSCTSA